MHSNQCRLWCVRPDVTGEQLVVVAHSNPQCLMMQGCAQQHTGVGIVDEEFVPWPLLDDLAIDIVQRVRGDNGFLKGMGGA